MRVDDVNPFKRLDLRQVQAEGLERALELAFSPIGDFRPWFGAAHVQIAADRSAAAPSSALRPQSPWPVRGSGNRRERQRRRTPVGGYSRVKKPTRISLTSSRIRPLILDKSRDPVGWIHHEGPGNFNNDPVQQGAPQVPMLLHRMSLVAAPRVRKQSCFKLVHCLRCSLMNASARFQFGIDVSLRQALKAHERQMRPIRSPVGNVVAS